MSNMCSCCGKNPAEEGDLICGVCKDQMRHDDVGINLCACDDEMCKNRQEIKDDKNDFLG